MVYLASDHAGFSMKAMLAAHLTSRGVAIEDCGAFVFDADDDYPDFVAVAAQQVSAYPTEHKAIVLGGSGQGEAIVANRFPYVRAVVFNGQYHPPDGRAVPDEISLTREHNDANVLSLGARFLSFDEARDVVDRWLSIPFSGEERHVRRIRKIDQYPPRS